MRRPAPNPTGSQWDLVQVFAWGRMLAVNVRELSFCDAAERTFSPEGQCAICEAVSAAKQQEENPAKVPSGKAGEKILLDFEAAPSPIVTAPAFALWGLYEPLAPDTNRAAPLVPPPRV